MNSFKKQCIELRKKDKTLNEIVKITGRSKTSVYFHIKNLTLSNTKREEIKNNTRKRALKNSAARKGIALRPYKPFTKWTPDLVLLVAHLSFDGEIKRRRCVYHNRSKALIDRVTQLMKYVYAYPAKSRTNPETGVIRIEFSNVELRQFLYDKSQELFQLIYKMPKAFQREFLRAFFDDEGCMDVRLDRNLRRVRGYQKDKSILDLVQVLLTNFSIESKIRKPNEVVISGKENLKKFQKEINFSEGVRLNPNRTNSLWKKNIEKRELLDMAIKSFKT